MDGRSLQAQTAADVHFPVGSWICVQGEKWGVGWGEDLGVRTSSAEPQLKGAARTSGVLATSSLVSYYNWVRAGPHMVSI